MQRINPQSDSYSALMWDVISNVHRYTPEPGARVLDLGAHYGIFSLFCAARGCKVAAYEPTPVSFTELMHSAEVAETIGLGSINPVEAAVWSEDGQKALVEHADTSGGNRLVRWPEPMANLKHPLRMVRTVSLKTALAGQFWDCVKVDIEGAEHEVFAKMDRADLELILFLTIEIHNDLLNREQVAELKSILLSSFPRVVRLPVIVAGKETDADSALFCWR